MSDGEQRSADAHAISEAGGLPVQSELRGTRHPEHFDILPQHAAGVPGPERLHRRFLRRKPPGQMRGGVPAPRTISNLMFGEDAPQEVIAIALEDIRDTRDVGDVEPETDDAHDATQA